jgi:hypothetical protein
MAPEMNTNILFGSNSIREHKVKKGKEWKLVSLV